MCRLPRFSSKIQGDGSVGRICRSLSEIGSRFVGGALAAPRLPAEGGLRHKVATYEGTANHSSRALRAGFQNQVNFSGTCTMSDFLR